MGRQRKHSGACSRLGGGGHHVDRYTQKERTFLTREIALEDVGVVLSLPGFGRQDVNINKQTI